MNSFTHNLTSLFIGILIMGISTCKRDASKPVSQEFMLVYTADIMGELEPCGCPKRRLGGLAQRASYVEKLKDQNLPLVQVDAGNVFFRFGYKFTGRRPDQKLIQRAEVLARGMARMNVDAINIGSSDLAAGLEALKDKLGRPEGGEALPLISANLVDAKTGELIFPAFRVVEAGELKVGIFGVMREPPGKDPLVKTLDPQAAAMNALAELKDKVQFVIALGDISADQMARICQASDGMIDLAVTCYGNMPSKPIYVEGSAIVHPGRGGKFLGQMKINYDSTAISPDDEKKRAELKKELARLNAQAKILQGSIQEDPEFREKAQEVRGRITQVEKDLAEIPSPLQLENTLFPVDISIPMDPLIADWAAKALGRRPAGTLAAP
jgi:2',3'-cyclic-nucleotide 2'-phosphodiesterase (5'-nucleotidase family)